LADSKISDLTAVASVAGTNEFAVNESGTSKKATGSQISDYVKTQSVGKQQEWFYFPHFVPATTNGAAVGTLESTTNKVNYKVYDFDATTDESVHFQWALPKRWNKGTITFQVYWSSTATDTDGVAWALEAGALSDNEAIDTAFGTPVVVTDDAQSAAGEVYITSESSAVTIAGSPAVGDLCFFRLFRDVSDGNDDMSEDSRLIGIKIFWTSDAVTDA